MTADDPNGWADLRAEQLRGLEAEDFEELCFDLIRCEAFDRHDDPRVDGPAGRYVPDGGRDVLLSVRRAPATPKLAYQQRHSLNPLTEDHIGRTVYSCKSGRGWLNDALGDVREDRKEPSRAVEVLLEGGHFKLLINTVGILDAPVKRDGVSRTPLAHLAAAFHERMKEIDPGTPDPAGRIEILDAQDITGFLRARMPPSGPMLRWADRLGIVPLLHGLEAWRRVHVEDRKEPVFVDDTTRAELRASLLGFLGQSASSPEDLTGWLVGPPGVGKTRLILHLLERDPALAQRVRVAFNPGEALEALQNGRLLARYPDVVLIVDDCPNMDVESLGSHFRVRASVTSTARLLVITPAGRDVFSGGRAEQKWYLDALTTESAGALAAGALGGAAALDERVQGIVRLSEGYPWFVTLLAAESIAEQRAPRDMREAVQWALASRRERANEDELFALRLRRARCLLGASLTRRVDWADLPAEKQERVARAVGLSRWQEVVDTAEECVHRGILRRNLGWKYKYVTPHVVERGIIAWLLAPDGPDPGGKTLSRHGADFLADFFETIAQLGLPSSVLTAVARAGLADLRATSLDRGALQGAGMPGSRLRFVVRHEPASAARELHRRVSGLDVEELRARKDERRELVLAFEELAARQGTFEEAEDALFRLALAENEAYGNNATATWIELFFPEIHATYRSLADRMAVLERRMSAPEPSARLLAIRGAAAVLATRASRRAMEPLDGERPAATAPEARQARIQIWTALADRFMDTDPEVAARAKQVALEALLGAIRWGIGDHAMAVLAAHAEDYSDADRIALRNALAAVRTYEEPSLVGSMAVLADLEEKLSPRSFRERLRQHVGTWRPARMRKEDESVDDALAREGLAGDAPLLVELDWLVSGEAVRAHVFAFALGRRDEGGLLLAGLRDRARASREDWPAKVVFARYLGGWKEAGRAGDAGRVVRDMSGVPEDAESLALTIVELGADEERLEWIEAALRRGLLGAPCLHELARRRHWLSEISDERFEQFARTLLDGGTVAHAAAALELLVDRAEERAAGVPRWKPLLLRALERLSAEPGSSLTDHYWELGAALLVEHGETGRVAELAVIALCRPSGSADHAWTGLHRAAERDPVAAWRAVAEALSRRDAAAARLQLAFMFHRSSFEWPHEEVLSWVDHDERRGRAVVALVSRAATELDPILRALVQRFGAHSSVANEIIARMHSTNGLVPSLAEHDARHLERARRWLLDLDPGVRAFAKRLVESLEASHASHAAEEEDERRRWGT